MRWWIEQVISQFVSQFSYRRIRARDVWHMEHHLVSETIIHILAIRLKARRSNCVLSPIA